MKRFQASRIGSAIVAFFALTSMDNDGCGGLFGQDDDDHTHGHNENIDFGLNRESTDGLFIVAAETSVEEYKVGEAFSLSIVVYDGTDDEATMLMDTMIDEESVRVEHVEHGHESGTTPSVDGLTINDVNFDHEGTWKVEFEISREEDSDEVAFYFDMNDDAMHSEHSEHSGGGHDGHDSH